MIRIILLIACSFCFSSIKSQVFENFYPGYSAQFSIHIGDSLIFVGGNNIINIFRKDGSFKMNKYVKGIVYSIAEDLDGKVYFAVSYSGITEIPIFDGNDWSYITEEDGLPQNSSIYAIAFDSENNMWATLFIGDNHSQNFITKYDGHNWYTSSGVGDSVFFTLISELVIDSNDIVYFGSRVKGTNFNSNQFVFAINNEDTVYYSNENSDIYVADFHSSFIDRDNNIWFGGCYRTLARFDGTEWHNEAQNGIFTPTGNFNFWAINQDNNGYMILGTSNGLFIESSEGFTKYTVEDGMHYNYVVALAVDEDNNIWIATHSFGIDFSLMKFDGETFHSYFPSTPRGLAYEISFFGDKLIAHGRNANHAGLNIIENQFWNANITGDSIFLENTHSFTVDTDGYAWVLKSGLYRISLDDYSYEHITEINDMSITPRYVTSYGNTVWVYNGSGILYKKSGGEWTVLENTQLINNVTRVKATSENEFWLCGNGLYYFNGTVATLYSNSEHLPGNYNVVNDFTFYGDSIWLATRSGAVLIYNDEYSYHCNDSTTSSGARNLQTVHIDKNGLIWFGSKVGALSYDGNEITYYEPTGMQEEIYSIREDDNNNIWFTGSKAISKMNYVTNDLDSYTTVIDNKNWIYPNPAVDYFYLDLPENIFSDILDIYTITGKLVKRLRFFEGINQIDIKDLNQGIYYVKLQESNISFKLVVK